MYVPINAVTGKPYQGKNVETLFEAAKKLNTDDPRWATFLQVKLLWGHAKKGSKGTSIVVAKKVSQENSENYGNDTKTSYKHYIVFNAVQVEGMPSQ